MTKSFPHDASHEPAEIVRPRSAPPIRVAFASRPVLKRADSDEPPLPLSGTSIIQTAAENWEPIWKLIRPCCRTVCGGRRFRRFLLCLGRSDASRPWGRPVMRTSWIICSAQFAPTADWTMRYWSCLSCLSSMGIRSAVGLRRVPRAACLPVSLIPAPRTGNKLPVAPGALNTSRQKLS